MERIKPVSQVTDAPCAHADTHFSFLPSWLPPTDRPTHSLTLTVKGPSSLPLSPLSLLSFSARNIDVSSAYIVLCGAGEEKTGKGAMAEVGISAFTLTRSLIKASDVQLANPFLL